MDRAGARRRWRRCCWRWIVSRRSAAGVRRGARGGPAGARASRAGAGELAGVVDRAARTRRRPAALPALVAEGVVGATFGVIHARLLELRPEPLVGLLGQLMATIVLPYRGSAAAAKELERPAPRPPLRAVRRDGDGLSRRPLGAASPVDYRLTVRTQMALAAVGGRPGLNNREVSEIIGLADQGQISRMMKRLSDAGPGRERAGSHQPPGQGVAADEGRRSGDRRAPSAQAGAAQGRQRRQARHHPERRRAPRQEPADARAGAASTAASTGFRMTALTHEVLAAVATLSEWGATQATARSQTSPAVKDEGQISKLLARLQDHGLLENSGGTAGGAANAWQLTPRGEEILQASRPTRGSLEEASR